jgi:hypothetical protein
MDPSRREISSPRNLIISKRQVVAQRRCAVRAVMPPGMHPRSIINRKPVTASSYAVGDARDA